MSVDPFLSARALAFGRYLSMSIAARTRAAVSGATRRGPSFTTQPYDRRTDAGIAGHIRSPSADARSLTGWAFQT